MEDSNDDNLETNWVFVEEVDIAEDALTLDPSKDNSLIEADNSSQGSFENSKDNIFTEADTSLRGSFENISKSYSDSQLLVQDDNLYKCLDKQNVDHDSESDGLSIISNWSYSQSTPDVENSDDGADDKEKDETLIDSNRELKQHVAEKIENNTDAEIQNDVDDETQNVVNDEIQNYVEGEIPNGDKVEKENNSDYQNVVMNNENSHKLIEKIEDVNNSDHETLELDEADPPKENEVIRFFIFINTFPKMLSINIFYIFSEMF